MFFINNLEINNLQKSPIFLLAPLDWGIGHATRLIPIISALLSKDCKIIIAADGHAGSLLKQEFPQIEFVFLKGYKVSYSKHKKYLPIKIFFQIPHILFSIYKEHLWLKKVVKKYLINAVISDNRFGLYHAQIPCVYITHQLLIKTNNQNSERFLQRIHNFFIKKYTQCWVPDFGGINNIAGQLSHPVNNLPLNVKYIGGLSRFNKIISFQQKYDLLIILSGPEPQRTMFESLLLDQLVQFEGEVLFVRGLPKQDNEINFTLKNKQNILIKNHLAAIELNKAIEQSALIISRSGYTTIMDLLKLQKKAILVPTPGQTEQEYLACHLMNQKIFYKIEQDKFILDKAILAANGFNYTTTTFNMEIYKEVVYSFIEDLDAQ